MAHDTTGRTAAVLCLLAVLVIIAQFGMSFSQGPNNRNVSVDAQVNVTGSAPEILNVLIADSQILTAGGLTMVTCNATVRDFNSFSDIDTLNATFFSTSQSVLGALDDNNTHYTNTSCTAIPGEESGAFANYTCSFQVNYYAVNDTWNCTIDVNDSIDLQGRGSNLSTITELFALNVSTLIDYGQMAVGDTSGNQEANVSNLGNKDISVSVRGYGRTLDDGWGMVCEQGNLTVDTQHFAANSTATYAQKQILAQDFDAISGLTISKPVDANGTLNRTYWQLQVPSDQNVFGICNGTIVFQAQST